MTYYLCFFVFFVCLHFCRCRTRSGRTCHFTSVSSGTRTILVRSGWSTMRNSSSGATYPEVDPGSTIHHSVQVSTSCKAYTTLSLSLTHIHAHHIHTHTLSQTLNLWSLFTLIYVILSRSKSLIYSQFYF